MNLVIKLILSYLFSLAASFVSPASQCVIYLTFVCGLRFLLSYIIYCIVQNIFCQSWEIMIDSQGDQMWLYVCLCPCDPTISRKNCGDVKNNSYICLVSSPWGSTHNYFQSWMLCFFSSLGYIVQLRFSFMFWCVK